MTDLAWPLSAGAGSAHERYRPGKSVHGALAACRQRCWKYDWAIATAATSSDIVVPPCDEPATTARGYAAFDEADGAGLHNVARRLGPAGVL
jgi:hypothetical protein